MDIIKIEIVNDNQIKYIYEDGTYSNEVRKMFGENIDEQTKKFSK